MALSRMDDPDIRPEIVRGNPAQPVSANWRWGPEWKDDERSGCWVIHTVYHVAIRVELSDSESLLGFHQFSERLEEVRLAPQVAIADARLVEFAKAEALSAKLSRGQHRRREHERLRREVEIGHLGGPTDGQEVLA